METQSQIKFKKLRSNGILEWLENTFSLVYRKNLIIFIVNFIMYLTIFLLSLSVAFSDNIPPQNPVIGVYTQTDTQNTSYIAASYVKFIQMSGAQVVPIFSFSDTSKVLTQLSKINGVLFPGGGMQFSLNNQWTRNADAIFKYAKEQNQKGNPFPLFCTCLGFQLISYLSSNYDSSILTAVQGDDAIVLPIDTTNEQSYLMGTFTRNQMEKMTKGHGLMYFNHHWAVRINTFNQNKYLKGFWKLIATSTTPFNEEFVSVVEAKDYPFFGVQFHPQKNLYEWKVFADRSAEGIQVVQIMSNRFVEYARKNTNRFASAEQFTNASIYNYKAQQSSRHSFTQIYVFNEKPRVQHDHIRTN